MKVGYFKVKPAVPVVRSSKDLWPAVSVAKLPTVKTEIKTPAPRGLRVLTLPAVGLLLALLLISGLQYKSTLDFSRYQAVVNVELPASVAFLSPIYDLASNWLETLINWLINVWHNLIYHWRLFFGLEKPIISVSPPPQVTEQLLRGEDYGLAVVPAVASTAREQLVKDNLQKMFADQVDLKFDPVESSGIVTPVFRDGDEGGDYVFILTPIK